jgi:hypothetical protein
VDYSVTWQFDVDKNSPQEELAKIFRENSISNYITNIIGAKSRQAVSEVTFPHFNANWSKILSESMLGDKVYLFSNREGQEKKKNKEEKTRKRKRKKKEKEKEKDKHKPCNIPTC